MRRRRTRVGRLLLALVPVVVLVVGGGAIAFWRSTGSGAGAASTGTTSAIRLDPGTATPGLFPGGTTSVAVLVSNSNDVAVRFGSLVLDTAQGSGGFAVDGAHAGCSTSALAFTASGGGAGYTVPARANGVDGTLSITLTGALSMAAGAADACQGAAFTVYLTAAP